MADWKTIDGIYKRQAFNFTGTATRNLSDIFYGTGVNNAGVFTLTNGVILASNSCDYWTNWAMSGTSLTVESKVETWSSSPTVQFVDLEDQRNYPIYLNGYHTPITLNSGYCIYTLEISCKGKFIVYENEVPVQFQGTEGVVATPMKIFRRYYNQKAESLTIRINASNVTWAYLSFAAYYTKTTRNVTNTAIVMENVYDDPNLGNGITIPPGEIGGGEGGEGETPNQYPVLGSIGWGLTVLGYDYLVFDFYKITDVDTNDVPDIVDGEIRDLTPGGANSSLNHGTHITIPKMTNPYRRTGTGNIYFYPASSTVQYLQFGMPGYPIDETIEVGFTTSNPYCKIVQYTTNGVGTGTYISTGTGEVNYIQA